MVAEREGRRWLSFEDRKNYLAPGVFRFLDKKADPDVMREAYDGAMAEGIFDLGRYLTAHSELALL